MRIRLSVSSCLLGEEVRYNGGHKRDDLLRHRFDPFVVWIPVCPEHESGLPVPREPMHLQGPQDSPRLITNETRRDLTGRLQPWIERRLAKLEQEAPCGFIFKAGSPSCGLGRVPTRAAGDTTATSGPGLFARAVMRRFPWLPVTDEQDLRDPGNRQNFVTRMLVLHRWRICLAEFPGRDGLLTFHRRLRLLLQTLCPQACAPLARIIRDRPAPLSRCRQEYLLELMCRLRHQPADGAVERLQQETMAALRPHLSSRETTELRAAFEAARQTSGFRRTLRRQLRDYSRKYRVPGLVDQFYLTLHPLESEVDAAAQTPSRPPGVPPSSPSEHAADV